MDLLLEVQPCIGEFLAQKFKLMNDNFVCFSMMTPHGPDAKCFESWTQRSLGPIKVAENTMAFMFESSFSLALTKWGEEGCGKLDKNYIDDWKGIRDNFEDKCTL